MNRRSTFRLFAAAACVACYGFSSSAKAEEVTLRFGVLTAESTRAFKQVLEPLARSIETASQQRIKVDLRGSGPNGFGKPAELLGMLERGEIDIAYTVQGYTPGKFPRTTVMELPLMYRSAEEGARAFWGDYKEGLFDKEYDGLKVLALNTAVPFRIFSATKPITSLKDFRGMRIRVPSPTVGLALARFGAVPIGLPVNLIGESIASGMVDAIAYSADSLETTPGINGKPILDQVKAVFDAEFAAPALMIVMSQKVYDGLPKDLQKAIDDQTGAPLTMAMAKDRDDSEAAALKRLKADSRLTYAVISPEQREEMAKLIGPVMDDWKKSLSAQGVDGDKLLERTRAFVAQKTASAK